jgi:hypothetical protein
MWRPCPFIRSKVALRPSTGDIEATIIGPVGPHAEQRAGADGVISGFAGAGPTVKNR